MDLHQLSFNELCWISWSLWIEEKLIDAGSPEEEGILKEWRKAVKKEWTFARFVREKRYYDGKSESETPAFFRGVNKIEWENGLKQRMGLEDPAHQKIIDDILMTSHKEKKAMDTETNGLNQI